MDYNDLKIASSQAEKILKELYSIQGTASPLPGDTDFNFRIDLDDQPTYILKIGRSDGNEDFLNFQQELLQHIEKHGTHINAPKVVLSSHGHAAPKTTDVHDNTRVVRLLTWIPGRLWSQVNPQLNDLRTSLGIECGKLTNTLQGFDHPQAHRDYVWDVAQSLWTKDHLHLFDSEEQEIIRIFQQKFEDSCTEYSRLRKGVVHNDANDNNVLVSESLRYPKVVAAIDYGDAVYTQLINDLGIACAYAIMGHNDPLDASLAVIKGYHESFPLEERELNHLYNAIAMRLVISVTKSALNKVKEPDNAYLVVSEKPAWDVLRKWSAVNAEYASYSFRNACGFDAHPNVEVFKTWALKNTIHLSSLFPTIERDQAHHLDLSVSSKWIGHQNDFNDLDLFQFKIDKLQRTVPDKIIAGGYLEPRPIYTSTAYDTIGNHGRESRTIHLGVDFWLPAHTPVHALFDGEIVTAVNDAGDKEYGGLIITKHTVDGLVFYILHGHLTVESAESKTVGQFIKKGDCIGYLGNYPENGNWAPHLHFQIMHTMLDYTIDFPGVSYKKQLAVWRDLCPDPNLLFKTQELAPKQIKSNEALIAYRKQHLGKSLSLQYDIPIKMVRGAGQYLMDQFGTKYLDTVNNVAHVGHEHPAVVTAGQTQMGLINTNSRYLHDDINSLAEALLETLPPELSVLHFVNSGSEANELAIRMVKAVTGSKDIIVSEMGYHGNTNMCIDISSYKFDGTGGSGAPEHTHIFPIPDAFRGAYRGENTGEKYADEVQKCIDIVHAKDRKVGALIIEPIISCGGQIELPDSFLKKAYEKIRNAGGICISDEVQVGCGRMGNTFWGFQLHDVIPDIITIGKPLGNGHPLAAVACTQEVAHAFANGMEYFNTFGGNPVSCAIGTAVLRTVQREGLQQHAQQIGAFLTLELKALAKEFPIIGDVRGQGLFLGIELVNESIQPLPEHTHYLANRMKDHGILMSIDGPDHNVLKIKPPLVFTKENAEELLQYLRKILAEDFMTEIPK